MKKYLFVLLWFSATTVQAQISEKTERALLKSIEEHYADNLKLLEQTVNINSGTLNHEGVRAVGDVLTPEFVKLGFKSEWINLPDSLNRAGHLVLTRTGTKGKKLFLIGHLDTVFEKSMEFSPFKIIGDTIAVGQGVSDMKGGNVLILAALQAIDEQGLLKDRSITVYFTGDEEYAGRPTSISRADFIERGKQCDLALAFEGAGGLHTVTNVRRGASEWKLSVQGIQAHSSRVFSDKVGYGAIFELARVIDQMRQKLKDEQYLTFNPGQVVAGSFIHYDNETAKGISLGKTNITAKSAYITGDLRFIDEAQKERVRGVMRQVCRSSLPQTVSQITFSDGIPAMSPRDENEELIHLMSKLSQNLGYGEVTGGDPMTRGAGDISYVAPFIPGMDGLGASGEGAHTPDENLNLIEFPKLIKRNTLFMAHLLATE